MESIHGRNSNVNKTIALSPNTISGQMPYPEDNASSQLPTINKSVKASMTRNQSINQSQADQYTNTRLERNISTADDRKRVASAFMNRRVQQGRVVTAGLDQIRKKSNMSIAKSNNLLSGGASNMLDRQSQMDLAQSSSAYHRQMVQAQQVSKEKRDKILPHFVK